MSWRNVQLSASLSRLVCPAPVAVHCRRCLLTDLSRCPQLTMTQARDQLREIVGSSKSFAETRDSTVTGLKLAESQAELPVRGMQDSYCEACIPLGQDPSLREKYINFHSTVRFGRIMEDLDTMAVLIGYTHNRDLTQGTAYKSPLSIVTALVDSMDISVSGLQPDRDIVLRGHTTWTGGTSMEVSMNVEQELDGVWHCLMDTKFLMVARDPQNKRKAYVNALAAETPVEQQLLAMGQSRKVQRQQEAQESLLKTPPSEKERLIIHDMFLQTLRQNASTFKHPVKPDGSVWMEDTLLKNVQICFPEQRNLYNKIFGGFLMRQAFELGWANACVYSQCRPYIVTVDDIAFRRPVRIGSLLYLSSQVEYTEGPYMQIKVHAEVVNPTTGERHTTNTFHYTFTIRDKDVPKVIPQTYAEYMMYLDGRRHFEASGSSQ